MTSFGSGERRSAGGNRRGSDQEPQWHVVSNWQPMGWLFVIDEPNH
jgi:hypothetical protein